MNEKTKITLSLEEKALISNTAWILTKRGIIEKVIQLFNNLLIEYRQVVHEKQLLLPAELARSTPKIARGENYRLLPYVLLDYPKIFDKENVFALRTLFWWGNFFSCTLHISGHYKQALQNKILQNLAQNKTDDWWVCINTKEWEHHFFEDNYNVAGRLTGNDWEAIKQNSFMKIACKVDLSEWENTPSLMLEKFKRLMELAI